MVRWAARPEWHSHFPRGAASTRWNIVQRDAPTSAPRTDGVRVRCISITCSTRRRWRHSARLTWRCVSRTRARICFTHAKERGGLNICCHFREPFNNSKIYADPRLLALLSDFLQEQFKLELMTVITSPPGSKHQRWHQGWRYLFHPDERLPPFAVVVALPLADVTPDMGPTEMCPGKKLRFYHGWRCNEHSLRLGSTAGTVVIFDYKTLHRGPANEGFHERPMVSMVFSKMFFLNTEAVVNRGHLARSDAAPASVLGAVHVAPKDARRTICCVDELLCETR